ncbi:MAG: serine/threonine-protein kinase [Nannocystaceae bacterium]
MSAPAQPAPAATGPAKFDPETMIGRVIAERYELQRLLGEGGMGAVFVALHRNLNKQVAFKIIRPEFAEEKLFAERFRREARTTAQLEHPHIVSALDYDLLPEGGAYLVLQLAPGESLFDFIIRSGALTWQQTCTIGAQIADALQAAHAMGIVHRDLKPDNVLVQHKSDGRLHARVLDFGLVGIVAPEPLDARGVTVIELTRQGAILGTPGYMAPEQVAGRRADERADLYSLGVMMWECLQGKSLWRADTFTDLFTMQFQETPEFITTNRHGPVPTELAKLIEQLLSREAGSRPPDADTVRQALDALARREGDAPDTSAPNRSVSAKSSSPAIEQRPTSVRAQLEEDPTARKAVLALGAGSLAVIVLAILIKLISG